MGADVLTITSVTWICFFVPTYFPHAEKENPSCPPHP
jgi:hypothetical protein